MEIQIFHQRQNNYKSISMWLECFFLRLHNHWVGVHFVGSVQCIHKGLYEWHPCQIDDFRCSNSIHETHSYFCFNYVQSRARDLVHIRKASDRKGRLLRENCILPSLCIFWWVVSLSSLLSAVQYMRFLLWRCVAVFLIVCSSAEGWYLKTDVSDDWITLNHRYEHAVTFRTLPFAEESNQTGMEVWTKYQIAWYASNARVQQIISVILMDWESIHIFLHLLIHIRLAWHSEINKLFVLFFFFFFI